MKPVAISHILSENREARQPRHQRYVYIREIIADISARRVLTAKAFRLASIADGVAGKALLAPVFPG